MTTEVLDLIEVSSLNDEDQLRYQRMLDAFGGIKPDTIDGIRWLAKDMGQPITKNQLAELVDTINSCNTKDER